MKTLCFLCDSCFIKALKQLPTIHIHEKCDQNDWTNVVMSETICMHLTIITSVCILGFIIWKIIELWANRCEARRKRRWEVNNREWKLKNDLYTKLIDFLEKQTIEEYDKDGKVIKYKNLNSTECNTFKDTLNDLIKNNQSYKKDETKPKKDLK